MKNSRKIKSCLLKYILIVSFSLLILGITSVQAADITVGPSGADYTSIQDAINASSDSDIIIIWNGTYTENVDVNKSVTITGNGSAWCHVIALSSSDHVFDVSVDDVNISGLNISGAYDEAKYGIYTNGDNTYIHNCTASNNSAGFYLDGGWGNFYPDLIENCTAHNNSRCGIIIHNSNGSMITNCIANNNTGDPSYGYGIWIFDAYNTTIINNNVWGNDEGIQLWSDCSDNIIAYNEASENNEAGIRLTDVAENNIVSYNIARENGYRGIHIDNTNFSILTNNNASNNSYYGIYVYKCENTTLQNNTASNTMMNGSPVGSGIYVQDSHDNLLNNNTVNNNNYSGIYLFDSSNNDLTNNTVLDNNPSGVGTAGICLQASSSQNTVRYNNASGNVRGIQIYESNQNTVENNTALSNDQDGFNCYTGCDNNFSNNTASNNEYGFHVLQYSNNNTFSANNASANTVAGFYLRDSENATLINNTANSNMGSGIEYGFHLETVLNSTLINNTAMYNDYGIRLIDNASLNILHQCNTSYNLYYGIFLINFCENNTITNNTAQSNSQFGISLQNSCLSNTIRNNSASLNGQYDIHLLSSSANTIYNNFFNSSENAFDDSSNTWNISKTSQTNIIGGQNKGGNFYGNNTAEDRNGDGIGDTIYQIAGGSNSDQLPLVYGGIYVDDDAAAGWYDAYHVQTVQEGETNSTSVRNKVYVFNGSYNENVIIDTSIDLIGNGSSVCNITAADNDSHVLSVTVDNVNISGLNLTGANDSGRAGIHFQNADFCTISDVISRQNYYGIYFVAADNCTINNSHIRNNSYAGFYLTSGSNDNTISSNAVIYNDRDGTPGIGGFLVSNSNRVLISNNNVSRNDVGIRIDTTSQNCTTHNNTVINNTNYGIEYFTSADYGLITNNTVTGPTTVGIYLINSNFSTCKNNTVTECTTGLQCSNAYNNTIFNNFFNNSINAVDNQENIWNITKTLANNILNGSYLGGNYWYDYVGADTDHDGLGNTLLPYNNTGNITYGGDYSPLVISPEVLSTSPTNASTGVSRSTNIVITFSKSMNHTTLQNNLTFSHSFGKSYSWNSNNTTLTINPSSDLSYSTTYTITVGWDATDTTGNVMVANYSFNFRTGSAPSGGGGGGAVAYPPTADAGGPYSGTVGSSITFDGSGSSDEDGTIESYEWDFGDGSSGSGMSPTHTYTGVETYTVTLTVTDNSGLTDSDTATVTVDPVPPVAPNADANGPYVGVVNQQIIFDGSGSSDSDGSIVSYEWSCGDESSVNGVNPTHMYTTAGTFDVMLTVTGDDGLTDNDTTTVTIYVGESVDIPNGFVIDTDGDGTVDSYLNESSGTVTTMQETDDGDYLIDDNNDGTYDETYDPATGGVTPYSPAPTPEDDDGNIWIYIAIIIIAIIAVIIFILFKMGILVYE